MLWSLYTYKFTVHPISIILMFISLEIECLVARAMMLTFYMLEGNDGSRPEPELLESVILVSTGLTEK